MARQSAYGAVLLVAAVLPALALVQPSFQANYDAHPLGYGLPLIGLAALLALLVFRTREWDAAAFCTSSLSLLGLLGSTAWGSYPNILIATGDATQSLTVTNASAGRYGLEAAFWWFILGLAAVVVYQSWIHRLFRGPVKTKSSDFSIR